MGRSHLFECERKNRDIFSKSFVAWCAGCGGAVPGAAAFERRRRRGELGGRLGGRRDDAGVAGPQRLPTLRGDAMKLSREFVRDGEAEAEGPAEYSPKQL